MYIDIVQLRCEILLMFISKALLNKPYRRNKEIVCMYAIVPLNVKLL